MSDDSTSSEYCPVQRGRGRGKRARRGLAAVCITIYLALSIPKFKKYHNKIIYLFTKI